LVDKYGYQDIAAEVPRRDGWPAREEDEVDGGVPVRDDYTACQITRKEDWIDLFARPFYFGCEADDRMNAVAFGKLSPFGARLNAIFSSALGDFDVPDMRMVLPEAYELVDDGLITPDDFRDFTFANPVRLWGTQKPDFFTGTAVARQAPRCSHTPALAAQSKLRQGSGGLRQGRRLAIFALWLRGIRSVQVFRLWTETRAKAPAR
jgi:hypothetical protein